ncbi:hypothetical protein VTJ49DRAFT_7686 [Mycothermus thermophilus]|uniref:Exoribonuclease phosphorolytic domain-containing protein n=1 Tax=Humicola insolens TaxID=85995 RepID=A0ABR3VHN7_HUMIN
MSAPTPPTVSLPAPIFAKLTPHPFLLRTLRPSEPGAKPLRTNGRTPAETRPLRANPSSLSHAHGSALVRAGDTTVVCGVRAELLPVDRIPQFRPLPLRSVTATTTTDNGPQIPDAAAAGGAVIGRGELKDYDLLVPNIELATGSAPQFLPGVPPTTLAQTLSTRVYSLLHSTRMVDVDDLRVWYKPSERGGGGGEDGDVTMTEGTQDVEGQEEEPERVVAYWVLYIDLLFVSFDGNPFDVAWAAVVAALRDTQLPVARWDPDREILVCSPTDKRRLNIRGLPVACSAAVFLEKELSESGADAAEGRHWLLMDPDRAEEALCREVITVVVDCSDDETRIKKMESLSDIHWDVVISGTGLQQSLLALALSRSGKKILHIDSNDFYGGAEASLGLEDAESWVSRIEASSGGGLLKSASISRPEDSSGLASSRLYYLALAPQVIHARSALLSQLVSSRAYRQVEFLAVGSFYIFKPASEPTQQAALVRIPSTREEVFSTTAVSTKGKRLLMKFLKFVLDHESSPQLETWQPYANAPLTDLLRQEFKMDEELQTFISTLTLSLDPNVTTKDGLAVIRRHISSMGVYGPGFAAIYPKWGGLSEIAQVSCRACAVGGGVYMLGTGIRNMEVVEDGVKLELTSGDAIRTRLLVRASDAAASGQPVIRRLVAVTNSSFESFFEPAVEGAPRPAVAIIAFPAGSLSTTAGKASEYPVYLSAHSSETGECPAGQSVLYLTTTATPDAQELLIRALDAFLNAASTSAGKEARALTKLEYEQGAGGTNSVLTEEGPVLTFPAPFPSLAFNDSVLDLVRVAWKKILGDEAVDEEYLVFADREGVADDGDVYE